MSAVFEAHLRLLTELRERITTHVQHRQTRRPPPPTIPHHMLVTFAELRNRGCRQREICRLMGIGSITYRRIRISLARKASPE